MANATSEARTTITSVPVNNIVDNLSWTKGRHTLQFGGNWRLIHQNRNSDAITWQFGSSNPYWLGGNPPMPEDSQGNSLVSDGFGNSYLIALANLVGTVPSLQNSYNYHVDSANSRHQASASTVLFSIGISRPTEFEWYVQDAWRVMPNLTLTFGLRHTILQTPYETSGQQVAPTIDTHAWYLQRQAAAQAGQIDQPNLEFVPSGAYYGRPGFWSKQKDNFAPRFAMAYSPDTKTSIRLGAGTTAEPLRPGSGEHLFEARNRILPESVLLVNNPAGQYSPLDGDDVCNDPSPRFLEGIFCRILITADHRKPRHTRIQRP